MSEIARIENEIILHGRRNNQAWFSPSMAVIPPGAKDKYPEVIVGVVQLVGNDIGPGHYLRSTDLGKTWTPPMESQNLFKIPLEDDIFERFAVTSGLYYHKNTRKLLVIGSTSFVRDRGDETGLKSEGYVTGRRGTPAYAVWNDKKKDFEPWKRFKIPDKLSRMGGVCTPGYGWWHECEGGDILFPCVYGELVYDEKGQRLYGEKAQAFRAGTFKCEFDGKTLVITDSGKTVSTDVSLGVHEPSMVEFGGRYLLTLRSESEDFRMYHAISKDGLNWEDLSPWCWDDGAEIETENTQQHWLKREDSLYLVYTRKSKLSKGVFRSRAPLWMAKVDEKTLQLVRESEVIVFPEKGARTGNFAVANVTSNESWIVTGEWLEGMFPDKKKGSRFYVDGSHAINYAQYIGDLLLARVYFL